MIMSECPALDIVRRVVGQYSTVEAMESALRGEPVEVRILRWADARPLSPFTADVGEEPEWCSGTCACGQPCGSFASETHTVHVCLIH